MRVVGLGAQTHLAIHTTSYGMNASGTFLAVSEEYAGCEGLLSADQVQPTRFLAFNVMLSAHLLLTSSSSSRFSPPPLISCESRKRNWQATSGSWFVGFIPSRKLRR